MSVQHETLDMQTASHKDDAPSLAYRAAGNDSLSMFLAAIGGAILGVLLTLLILAIINGGTLDYTGNARLVALEATLARVNENVGTLSSNVDLVAAEIGQVRSALGEAEVSLRASVDEQGAQVAEVGLRLESLDEALGDLEFTRKRFDTFVDALTGALAELDALEQDGAAAAPVQP